VVIVDVDELIQKAWKAVEKAGVPATMQNDAFKEAVAFLRDGDAPGRDSREKSTGSHGAKPKKPAKRGGTSRTRGFEAPKGDDGAVKDLPDRETFFRTLSSESGIEEQILTDVLQYTAQGDVHVLPPSKDLGDSKAAQARTVIALVAGARAHGLGEDPVDDSPVREEMKKKRCYDRSNFSFHLRPLKGFNFDPSGGLVLTSKWIDDFSAAIKTATGTGTEE